MIILAIESSCDETSVAILKDEKTLLAHNIESQIDIFKPYGGVVPEMASRNHVKVITMLIDQAILEADIDVKDIDLVAVTQGPGLIGALLVGINAATAFAYAHQIPVIGVNHLIGHMYSANLEHELKFPALGLLVSGGHTELIYMQDHMKFELIGQTLDDAVGEAYDKVAKMLKLGYPGGPIIDRLAHEGQDTYHLPRPYLEDHGLHFSFSGLKSAVLKVVQQSEQKNTPLRVSDVAASFQASVMDVIIYKLKEALKRYPVKQLIIAGGVAANQGLRQRLQSSDLGVEIVIPSMKYCTDNAAMIAAAAYHQYRLNPSFTNYLLGGDSTLTIESEMIS
jgi:N6-L-threonylcarbamoyladenine synthase